MRVITKVPLALSVDKSLMFDLTLLLAVPAAGLTGLAARELIESTWPAVSIGAAGPTRLRMEPLPWQYPPVSHFFRYSLAGLSGILVATLFLLYPALTAFETSVLVVALTVCATTDLLAYRVPDIATVPASIFAMVLLVAGGTSLSEALLSAALPGVAFAAVALLTRGGLGLGDVKLAVLIGAGLGLQAAAVAFAVGILIGGAFVIALYLSRRIASDQAVPFGPFLALAACGILLATGPSFAR
jgi:leader peptidase (prepilin peptidase)/N-methyltransferase